MLVQFVKNGIVYSKNQLRANWQKDTLYLYDTRCFQKKKQKLYLCSDVLSFLFLKQKTYQFICHCLLFLGYNMLKRKNQNIIDIYRGDELIHSIDYNNLPKKDLKL